MKDNLNVELESTGFFESLWADHQEMIINLGKQIILAIVVLIIAWLCNRALAKFIKTIAAKSHRSDEAATRLIQRCARYAIGFFAIMIILEQFGINTASLLTVLGAAGLAVGLALKDTLGNLASGIVLLITRPYKLGDYIETPAVSGTVTDMGIFTSTLTTPDGLYVSVPNSALWGTPIKNYSRNDLRRCDICVDVSYSDDIEKGVAVLLELMQQDSRILAEPAAKVLIAELADSSVKLQLRYWTGSENYWDVFWSLKKQLKGTLENAGLHIPFPQRVVTLLPEGKSE